jgi:hypothetical protein
MKRIMSLVLLISVMNVQAMENKPHPDKKQESIEELLRKAATLLAEQKIQQQEKEEKSKQEPNLKEAFFNFMEALTTEAKNTGTKLKTQMDNLMKEISEDSTPCSFGSNISEAVTTAKKGWENFKEWLETDEEEVVTLNIVSIEPEEKKTEESISLVGLDDQQVAFFKEMMDQARKK